jgi:hypothetical protein
MAKGIPLMGRDPDGKAKIINVDENGNVKVQLFENMLSRETVVLPREIRQVPTATIQVLPPNGLHPKGVSLILRVFGVTGTFGTDQGISLLSGQAGGGYPGYGAFYVSSERLTAPGFSTIIWYPGIRSDGVVPSLNSKFNIVSVPFRLGYMALNITGNFDTGQGFDCEVRAIWWV